MFAFLGKSVSQKLLIPILLSVLTLVTAYTTLWSIRYSHAVQDGSNEGIELIGTFASQPLGAALYTFDTNLAETTFNGFAVADGVMFARLLSLNSDGGTDLFAEWARDDSQETVWTDDLNEAMAEETGRITIGNWLLVRIPLHADDLALGYLDLAIDQTPLQSRILRTWAEAIVLGLGAFLLLAGIIYWVAKGLIVPLRNLVAVVGDLRAGNIDIDVPEAQRADEFGRLARSLEEFRDNLRSETIALERNRQAAIAQSTALGELGAGLQRMADRNFSQPIPKDYPEDYLALRDDFNKTLFSLSHSFTALHANTTEMTERSQNIRDAAKDLTSRAENNATRLEMAASAITDLNASVSSTVTAVQDVEGMIAAASNTSDRNSDVMQDAIAAMEQIEKASNQITSIVGLIDDIAFQTNLLALNAGVEAARAGEAGSGFAVVASEVRALAQRSSDATREINEVIAQSAASVHRGTGLVAEAGDGMAAVSDSVRTIREKMIQISKAAQTQANRISDMNKSVAEIDTDMKRTAHQFQQTSEASQHLSEAAIGLNAELKQYRTAPQATRTAA